MRRNLCGVLIGFGILLTGIGFKEGIWQEGGFGYLALFFLGMPFIVGGAKASTKGG